MVIREVAPDYYEYKTGRVIYPRKFLVRCVCGNENVVHLTNLVKGRSRSCGCDRPPPPVNQIKYRQYKTGRIMPKSSWPTNT